MSKKETRERKKLNKQLLDALSEKAELSNDRGDIIHQKHKLTRKDRRHSGRYTPKLHQKDKFSEMIANAEEPQEEYDDWMNLRDGMRAIWNPIFKKFHWKKSKKVKKMKERKKRKELKKKGYYIK